MHNNPSKYQPQSDQCRLGREIIYYNFTIPGVSGGRSGAAVVTCENSLTGRHVSVQLMDSNVILTVCEIQIMMSKSYIPTNPV